jgi:phosphoglycerate dehydrogenase-like enzyme
MDSLDRADFFANLKPGGRYDRTVAIYRTNESAQHVGVFDQALIDALPPTVRWIAHNGAGYDQVNVRACGEKGMHVKGISSFRAPRPHTPFRNDNDRHISIAPPRL